MNNKRSWKDAVRERNELRKKLGYIDSRDFESFQECRKAAKEMSQKIEELRHEIIALREAEATS
jgi:hypothetical protein